MPEETMSEQSTDGFTKVLIDRLVSNGTDMLKRENGISAGSGSRLFDNLDIIPAEAHPFLNEELYKDMVDQIFNTISPDASTDSNDIIGQSLEHIQSKPYPLLEIWLYELALLLRPTIFALPKNELRAEIVTALNGCYKPITDMMILTEQKKALENADPLVVIDEETKKGLENAVTPDDFEKKLKDLPDDFKDKLSTDNFQAEAEAAFVRKVFHGLIGSCIHHFIRALNPDQQKYLAIINVISKKVTEVSDYENIEKYLTFTRRPEAQQLLGLHKSLSLAITYLTEQQKQLSAAEQKIFETTKARLVELYHETGDKIKKHEIVGADVISGYLKQIEGIVTTTLNTNELNKHDSFFKQKINDIVINLVQIICAPFRKWLNAKPEEAGDTPGEAAKFAAKGVFKTEAYKSIYELKKSTELVTGIIEKKIEQQQKEQEDPSKPKPAPAI